jgi:DNA-binding MarR family transcriptional regulator
MIPPEKGAVGQKIATVGLSAAKYSVLALLADAGEPLALSDLAARTSCVRSNMTQLVDRLEADGLVRRVDDPADRRVVRAALTPLGEERQAEGAKQMAKVQKGFAASLTEVDRIALGDNSQTCRHDEIHPRACGLTPFGATRPRHGK